MALSPTGADLLLPQLPATGEELYQTFRECSEALSPLPSPFSDTSNDSGVLAEDEFLTSLFGEDFSMLVSDSHEQVADPLMPVDENKDLTTACPPATNEKQTKHGRVRRPTSKAAVSFARMDRNQRNAEMARQHRQKKKMYVESLENDREALRTENVILRTKTDELRVQVRKQQNEIQYLKSVLANQSTLAALISNIPDVPGVRLSTSFTASRKRPNSDVESDSRPKRSKGEITGGVCLHVSKDVVSLEFCPNCSHQAAESAHS